MTRRKAVPSRTHVDDACKRVLLVDDHPMMRDALRAILQVEDDVTLCGEVAGESEAMVVIREATPDLAIVDLSLAEGSGIDLVKRINKTAPQVRTLVFSLHCEPHYAERAMRAGARGFVSKREDSQTIRRAIRAVLQNQIWVGGELAGHVLGRITRGQHGEDDDEVARLSDRELEVFRLLGEGASTMQIAEHMCLSVKTVETYRARLKQKLGIAGNNKLLVRAANWAASHL